MWKPGFDARNHPQWFSTLPSEAKCLIQSPKPGLTSVAVLMRQLAVGILCLPSKAGTTGGTPCLLSLYAGSRDLNSRSQARGKYLKPLSRRRNPKPFTDQCCT